MQADQIQEFLDTQILEGEKRALLQAVADHPDRFQSLFYSHPASTVLLQGLLFGRERRFREALRLLVKSFLEESGFILLPERVPDVEGNDLIVDLHFAGGKSYYFIDQRLRDDLDRPPGRVHTRRNLVAGFTGRLDALYRLHGQNLVGILYFLDSDLVKHRAAYAEDLADLRQEYPVELHLFYGSELFTYLGHPTLWTLLTGAIKTWKAQHDSLPPVNMDSDPAGSFNELRTLDQRTWWSLLLEDSLWEGGVIQALFETGKTLRLLAEYFASQPAPPFPLLTRALELKLEKYYPAG